MPDFTTQREFTRVPVHIWGTFRDGDRELLTAEITSLSLRGCYARRSRRCRRARARLTLFTDDDDSALHITVTARIVRSDAGRHGRRVHRDAARELRPPAHDGAPERDGSRERVEQELRSHVGLKRAG